jgi:quinate dehydrogenase (quinone)
MKRASRATGVSRFLLLGLGVIIALLGIALAVGGAKLVSLGGSWYFLIGGVAMAIAGLLIARRNPAGAWLFAAFLVGTAI